MSEVNFADRLASLRKQKNISQDKLANDLGVVQSTVGMWESGKREPNNKMLIKIADYFEITIDSLLGRTDTKIDLTETVAIQRIIIENELLRKVIKQFDPEFFDRKCRVCGCTWNHACEGGCYWVKDDLCSRCAGIGR